MPDTGKETVVRYADALREAVAEDANVADQYEALCEFDNMARYRQRAAALRALAALCERAEGIQGCGDHSCLFEPPSHGLGTNGGCRCRNNPRIVPLLAAIHAGYREAR